MKNITVQLKDIEGNIVEEKNVQVSVGETLVMKFPRDMTKMEVSRCYELLNRGLEEGRSVIGLPDVITFEVIKIN